jgi:hypothetical protein
MMILRRLFVSVIIVTVFFTCSIAQTEINAVYTTVPYLTIAPDSRGGAMGDLGVATSPDVNSQNWNAAKFAHIKDKAGVTISFTPWLRNIVNDINLAYLAGFYKFNDKQTLSASLRYFSMGEVIFRNDAGDYVQTAKPNEFSIDAGYSRLLSDYFSAALVMRFIRSDITGGGSVDGQQYNAGYSFAADLGLYYQRPVDLGNLKSEFAWGINFSNLGTKISYTEGSDKQFIPANLRLGVRYTLAIDEYNSITAAVDLNKLLVPTPPTFADTTDDGTNNPVMVDGYKTPTSLPLSWIQSFYDAPGGFNEEMKEIMYSIGLEYWYREQFAIRAGYFHESASKGNRKYFAAGVGLKLNVFFIDFSYLISTSGTNNPLANTMRFTLGMNFPEIKKR